MQKSLEAIQSYSVFVNQKCILFALVLCKISCSDQFSLASLLRTCHSCKTKQTSTGNKSSCLPNWLRAKSFFFVKWRFILYKSVDLTTKCDDPNRSLRVGNISHSRVPLPAFIHMHTCTYFWLTVKIRCIYSDNTHLICVIRRWQCFVFFLWNGLLVKKK